MTEAVKSTLDALIKNHSKEELLFKLLPQVLESTMPNWNELFILVAQWTEQVLMLYDYKAAIDILVPFIKYGFGSKDVRVAKVVLSIYCALEQQNVIENDQFRSALMDAFSLILDERAKVEAVALHTHISVKLLVVKFIQVVISQQSEDSEEMLLMMQRHLKMSVRVDVPNVSLTTAIINALALVAQDLENKRQEIVKLFLELVSRKHSGARQHLYINKAMKNAFCHLLRKFDLGADASFESLDYLSRLNGNHIRADIHYLGSAVKERGHIREKAVEDDDYEALLEQEMVETTTVSLATVSNEQKTEIVKDVLQSFPKDPSHPLLGQLRQSHGVVQQPVELPETFTPQTMGVDIIASVVLASLYTFGAGSKDSGVAQWKQVMESCREATTEKLTAIAKAELDKVAGKSKTSTRQPFRLDPSPAQPGVKLNLSDVDLIDIDAQKKVRQEVNDSISSILRHIFEYSPYGQKAAEVEFNQEDPIDDTEMKNDEEEDKEVQEDDQKAKKESANETSLQLLDAYGAQWLYQKSINRGIKRQSSLDQLNEQNVEELIKKPKLADMERRTSFLLDSSQVTALEETQVVFFDQLKGSRLFWSQLLPRYVCHFTNQRWFTAVADNKGKQKIKDAQLVAAQVAELQQTEAVAASIKVEVWISFLVHDFMARWDVAVRWLYEQFLYEHALQQQSYDTLLYELLEQIISTAETEGASFIPWMPQQGQNIVFRRFLTSLPQFPASLISKAEVSLTKWCMLQFSGELPTPLESFKIQLGMECVYDVINHYSDRGVRNEGLQLLLQCCVAPEKARRGDAIRIIRRWWAEKTLVEDEQHNTQQVVQASFRKEKFVNQVLVFSVQSLINLQNPYVSDELVLRWLDLYVVLCVRDASFFSHLFKIYHQVDHEALDVLNLAVSKIVGYIGMPSDEADNAYKLLTLFEQYVSLETLPLVKLFATSMMGQDCSKASDLYSQFFLRMQTERPDVFSDPIFWLCSISAEQLTKEQVYRGLIILADILLVDQAPVENVTKFCQSLSRVLGKHPAPDAKPSTKYQQYIHPVDLAVVFHCLDLEGVSDAPDLSLRKNLEVANLMIAHPLLQPFFTPMNWCYTFTACLDKSVAPKESKSQKQSRFEPRIPKLLMRTVMAAYQKSSQDTGAYILTHVLTRCVSFKSLWSGAKLDDKLPDDDDQKRAKALWEGWVRLLKLLVPQSFGLLIRIPEAQLKQILQKCGSETIQQFAGWVQEQLAVAAKSGGGQQRYKIAQNVLRDIEV